jgi:hypothetical protein
MTARPGSNGAQRSEMPVKVPDTSEALFERTAQALLDVIESSIAEGWTPIEICRWILKDRNDAVRAALEKERGK